MMCLHAFDTLLMLINKTTFIYFGATFSSIFIAESLQRQSQEYVGVPVQHGRYWVWNPVWNPL
jgi:hypothetical protein